MFRKEEKQKRKLPSTVLNPSTDGAKEIFLA